MADLLIENVPDELCCAYRSMSDGERRLVTFELAASVERITRKRPELDNIQDYVEQTREFRNGTLKPVTDELIEEAITGRVHCERPSIEEIRAFRESLNVPPLTEEFLERAINEGRV